MIAEPVGAIHRLGAVDADHQVPVCQDLEDQGPQLQGPQLQGPQLQGPQVTGATVTGATVTGVLTFLTVATQMADRFRGSMASSFIPSRNQEPLWSTSFTCRTETVSGFWTSRCPLVVEASVFNTDLLLNIFYVSDLKHLQNICDSKTTPPFLLTTLTCSSFQLLQIFEASCEHPPPAFHQTSRFSSEKLSHAQMFCLFFHWRN